MEVADRLALTHPAVGGELRQFGPRHARPLPLRPRVAGETGPQDLRASRDLGALQQPCREKRAVEQPVWADVAGFTIHRHAAPRLRRARVGAGCLARCSAITAAIRAAVPGCSSFSDRPWAAGVRATRARATLSA